MPKKEPKKEGVKKGNEKLISLYPLSFDETLQALVNTKPPEKSKPPPKKKS